MSRRVAVGLLTSMDPIREVSAEGYCRSFTFLDVASTGLCLINGIPASFPQAVGDWEDPIVGFAAYDLSGPQQTVLFTGLLGLGQGISVKDGDRLSFPTGSMRLEIS